MKNVKNIKLTLKHITRNGMALYTVAQNLHAN